MDRPLFFAYADLSECLLRPGTDLVIVVLTTVLPDPWQGALPGTTNGDHGLGHQGHESAANPPGSSAPPPATGSHFSRRLFGGGNPSSGAGRGRIDRLADSSSRSGAGTNSHRHAQRRRLRGLSLSGAPAVRQVGRF